MSTDLEFRLPTIEINSRCIKPKVKINSDGMNTVITIDGESHREINGGVCHTPRSPGRKIPEAVICPPAPKKRRPAAACKRKVWDLDFFEVAAREEVESLFRSTVQVNLNGSSKRKCTA